MPDTLIPALKNSVGRRVTVALFFIILAATGLIIYDDYGLSCDEELQRDLGLASLRYALKGDKTSFNPINQYHGPFFQIILAGTEKILGLEDTREIFLMRHLATFSLFVAGAFFFYLLCSTHFDNWRIGLLGTALLVIHPRIFADSFYNPKDLPFLSVSIIAVWAGLHFLQKKTLKWALFTGLACAAAATIRISGLLYPALFVVALLWPGMRKWPTREAVRAKAPLLILFLGTTVLLINVFWPFTWDNPLQHMSKALILMSNYPHPFTSPYFGHEISHDNPPWHYLPVWIAITTPLSILGCCIVGVLNLPHRVKQLPPEKRRDFMVISAWLVIPVAYVILRNSTLYNGWRHAYFIYPAVVIIALHGLQFLWKKLSTLELKRSLRLILVVLIAADLTATAAFSVRNHPYQYAYFNALVGGPRGNDSNFVIDYWGVSYLEGIEYIVRADPAESIPVHINNHCGRWTYGMFTAEARRRIRLVSEPEARYILGEYPQREFPSEKIYSVRVDGATLMSVYRASSINNY